MSTSEVAAEQPTQEGPPSTDEDVPVEPPAKQLDETTSEFLDDLVKKLIIFVEEFCEVKFFPYQYPIAYSIIESIVLGDGEEKTLIATRQCLDGDTVVLRRDGSACRLRDHEDAWSTGIKPTKRYRVFGGGEVVATDNHPFWTDRGWVDAGDLQVGDWVSTLDGWESPAPVSVSSDVAKLLGYMVTDGSMRPGQSFKFTNTNDAMLSEFSDICDRIGTPVKWYPKGSGYDLLITGDDRVRGVLKEFSYDDKFPREVFTWDRESVGHFLSASWSGDGCFNTRLSHDRLYAETFLAVGNSQVCAHYWQTLLNKWGVNSTVKEEWMAKSTKPFYRLVVGSGAENMSKFLDLVGDVTGKSQAVSDVREIVEANLQSPYTTTSTSGRFRPGHDGDDGESVRMARVVSIEDAGEREVWDVTVPSKGWFFANNVLVSNSGKALSLDTPVPTPYGWSKFKDVYPGDFVLGPEGRPVRVIAQTEVQVDRPCYEVRFNDGTSIVADANHEWQMADGEIRTTQELVECATPPRSGHGINLMQPFDPGVDSDLPVDPYVLGAWLGDGGSRDGRFTSIDDEILDRIREHYRVERKASYGPYGHYIYELSPSLIALGVMDPYESKQHQSKHIPESYLRSSVAQRTALLQGLMDTDGTVDVTGKCEFCVTRKPLADGFVELLRSLGIKCRMVESDAVLNGRVVGVRYRIHFSAFKTGVVPVSLERKYARLREAPVGNRRSQKHFVHEVVPVDSVPVKCIQVEGGLFVAGDGWVVTHNSEVVSNVIAGLMVILPVLASAYPTWLKKFEKGFLVGVFAPTEDQADTVFGRVVSKLTSDHAVEMLLDPEIGDKASAGGTRGKGKIIQLKKSGSICRMQTCNPKAKIESKTYHFAFIDEAQEADETMITKCVAAGTSVWVPGGDMVDVEQVVHDHMPVLSYDKPWDLRETSYKSTPRDRSTGDLIPVDPSEWHDNGVRPVWRVTTASGRYVDATANHRWVVRERKGNAMPKERTTDQLSVGMQLPLTLDAPLDNHGTGTLDEGYFSGQIIGDGCTSASVQWCGHRDGAMDEMVRVAESWGDRFSEYKVNPDNGLVEGAFVGGASKVLLEHYQLMRKTGRDKCLTTSGHSLDFYRGLIAGLVDSDGYVFSGGSQRGYVSWSSVSEVLARQVQAICQRLGVLGTLSVRDNSGGFTDNAHPLWTLTIKDIDSVRRFAEIVPIHTDHKVAALRSLVESNVATLSRRGPRAGHPRRGFGHGNLAWDRIVSIEYVGERPTFCVTVPSGTVVWNGFVGLNSIKPMLAWNNGSIVLGGTAQRYKSYFYNAIQYNKRRDVNGKGSGRKHHHEYDWKVAAKYNQNYADYIAKEKLRIGEDSDEFLLSYCNRWMLEKGMFVSEERLGRLYDVSMPVVPSWTQTPIVVGIDVARSNDSTVVTPVWVDWDHPDPFGFHEHRVLNWHEINNVEWESQYFEIIDFLRQYNVLRVGVDAQGVGGAVAERLQILMPNIEVLAVSSDAKAQNERWTHLTQLIQRDQLLVPGHSKARRTKRWKKFNQQMSDLEKVNRGPYMLAAAPDERGAFDDYPDSLAIACAMSVQDSMPEVSVSESPFFR